MWPNSHHMGRKGYLTVSDSEFVCTLARRSGHNHVTLYFRTAEDLDV